MPKSNNPLEMTKMYFGMSFTEILLELDFVWHLPKDKHGLAVLNKMRVNKALWGAAKEVLAAASKDVLAGVGLWAEFVSSKDAFLTGIPAFLSRGEYSDLLEGMRKYTMYKKVQESTMDALLTLAIHPLADKRKVMQQMIEDGVLATCVTAYHAYPRHHLAFMSLEHAFCQLVHYLICCAPTLEERVRVVERARESGVLEITEQGSQPGSPETPCIRRICKLIMDQVEHVDSFLLRAEAARVAAETARGEQARLLSNMCRLELVWLMEQSPVYARAYKETAEKFNKHNVEQREKFMNNPDNAGHKCPIIPPMIIRDIECIDLFDRVNQYPAPTSTPSIHQYTSGIPTSFENRDRNTMYILAIEQKKLSHQQSAFETAQMNRVISGGSELEQHEWLKMNPIQKYGCHLVPCTQSGKLTANLLLY